MSAAKDNAPSATVRDGQQLTKTAVNMYDSKRKSCVLDAGISFQRRFIERKIRHGVHAGWLPKGFDVRKAPRPPSDIVALSPVERNVMGGNRSHCLIPFISRSHRGQDDDRSMLEVKKLNHNRRATRPGAIESP